MRRAILVACLACLAACKESSSPEASSVPAWAPGVAYDTSLLPMVRGRRDYRGIIHLHSYLSHDACDGHKRSDFSDAACLADLRAAICATRQDYILLTDHPAYMRDHEFPAPLLFDADAGDELLPSAAAPAANRLRCDDGKTVLVQAGYESSALMPVGLHGHAAPAGAAREALYGGEDTATAEALIDAGARVFLPHSESKDEAWFSGLPIAAMEIYNLHANLDPDIRTDYLGLDAAGYFGTLLRFTNTAPSAPHPDLALLAFFSANEASLAKWDRQLVRRKIAGVAGTDAHENVFTTKMRDGERGDGYRRLMSFFSNHVRAVGPLDVDTARDAVAALRAYVAFEAFGVPYGFDFRAEAGGATFEMGDDAPRGALITLALPRVLGLRGGEAPEITGVIYRVDAAGRHEVAHGGEDLAITATAPGAYRAEVRIVPRHLAPYLADLAGALVHEYPWVYANPIFVR